MWVWLHKFASPPHFYRLAGQLVPWFGWSAFVLIVTALLAGLALSSRRRSKGGVRSTKLKGTNCEQSHNHAGASSSRAQERLPAAWSGQLPAEFRGGARQEAERRLRLRGPASVTGAGLLWRQAGKDSEHRPPGLAGRSIHECHQHVAGLLAVPGDAAHRPLPDVERRRRQRPARSGTARHTSPPRSRRRATRPATSASGTSTAADENVPEYRRHGLRPLGAGDRSADSRHAGRTASRPGGRKSRPTEAVSYIKEQQGQAVLPLHVLEPAAQSVRRPRQVR